jgi:hypothetical protein
VEIDGIGIVERLRVFLADADLEHRAFAIGRGMTELGIDMQDQHVAPVRRVVECCATVENG